MVYSWFSYCRGDSYLDTRSEWGRGIFEKYIQVSYDNDTFSYRSKSEQRKAQRTRVASCFSRGHTLVDFERVMVSGNTPQVGQLFDMIFRQRVPEALLKELYTLKLSLLQG